MKIWGCQTPSLKSTILNRNQKRQDKMLWSLRTLRRQSLNSPALHEYNQKSAVRWSRWCRSQKTAKIIRPWTATLNLSVIFPSLNEPSNLSVFSAEKSGVAEFHSQIIIFFSQVTTVLTKNRWFQFLIEIGLKANLYFPSFSVRPKSMWDQRMWTGLWCLQWATWLDFIHHQEIKYGTKTLCGNPFQFIPGLR